MSKANWKCLFDEPCTDKQTFDASLYSSSNCSFVRNKQCISVNKPITIVGSLKQSIGNDAVLSSLIIPQESLF